MTRLDLRALEAMTLKTEAFPPVTQEFRLWIAEEAFDRAVARGSADTSREVGGVLVGRVLTDQSGPYLRVDTTIDALHADEQGAELTFTHATWDHINQQMDKVHKNQQIVGWYHTHPGFGVFLSDRDQFIHKSFFNLPFQVAFVYDPKSREHGAFVWRADEVWRLRQYWIGKREYRWDGARERADSRPPSRTTAPADSGAAPKAGANPAGGQPSEPPLPLGAGLGLAIAGIAGLLLGWMGGSWFKSRDTEALVTRIQAQAQVEGARNAVASLNPELLGILRESMVSGTVDMELAQATQTLDQTLAGLRAEADANPKLKQVADQIAPVRDRLSDVRRARTSGAELLLRLENFTRAGTLNAKEAFAALALHQAVLGRACLELAEDLASRGKDADPRRARRLLECAAIVDPPNHAVYEQSLQKFEKDGRLPRTAARDQAAESRPKDAK
jgi:proteasome lid subunit RPN8/RPN11